MRRASRGVGELKKDCRVDLHYILPTKLLKIFFGKLIENDTFRRFIHLIQNELDSDNFSVRSRVVIVVITSNLD
jgi:hypothetical protein